MAVALGLMPRNLTPNATDLGVAIGFRGEKTPNNVFGNNVTLAFSDVFPVFNGLSISMVRLDFTVGGVIPVYSHHTSEVLILVKGSIIVGFIDTNNTAYYKKLEVGDVMVFPQAMLHFQINVGKIRLPHLLENPELQLTPISLFAGNLPADIA
ncbi:auxin-binding protein ABP19a-like [Chenopodium quinoa]|uniref:auxin-binding protein ABP19a-like n=1 Tax=Chenopodium quinoa TaxID=63459 RepID=UPI000B79AA9F|nr:auxin-binding protein ABP19a-like [Chenopodium quinoa]